MSWCENARVAGHDKLPGSRAGRFTAARQRRQPKSGGHAEESLGWPNHVSRRLHADGGKRAGQAVRQVDFEEIMQHGHIANDCDSQPRREL